jgi:hypothetical protein
VQPRLELGARNPDSRSPVTEPHGGKVAGVDLAVDRRRMLPELVGGLLDAHKPFASLSNVSHKTLL